MLDFRDCSVSLISNAVLRSRLASSESLAVSAWFVGPEVRIRILPGPRPNVRMTDAREHFKNGLHVGAVLAVWSLAMACLRILDVDLRERPVWSNELIRAATQFGTGVVGGFVYSLVVPKLGGRGRPMARAKAGFVAGVAAVLPFLLFGLMRRGWEPPSKEVSLLTLLLAGLYMLIGAVVGLMARPVTK